MKLRAILVLAAVAMTSLAFSGAHAAPISMCNVPIRMSDGAIMRANITRPDDGVHPTVLTVTGYNKDLVSRTGNCSSGESGLTAAGYNVVTIDDRGTGSSDGRWDIWGERTQLDYVEEADWLLAQPWQNGKIGTTGTSYLGITSLLFAEANPHRVQAIWADVPMSDAYRDVTWFGGNLDTTFMPFWFGFTQATNSNTPTQATQGEDPKAVALNTYDHWSSGPAVVGQQLITASLTDDKNAGVYAPYDQPSSRLRSPVERASKITAAVFYTGGWYDIFQRGEPFLFNSFRNAPENGVKWVQAAAYHGTITQDWDAMGIGSRDSVRVKWFDHWLKGVDNGVETIDPIHHWVIGADKWETDSRWPASRTDWQSLYLSPATSGSATSINDGTLSSAAPVTPEQQILPYVPTGGLCNRSSAQWSAGAGAGTPCETDQRAGEPITLTYSTPALGSPLHVHGPITLDLWAELDRTDTSFYAALTDVAPDGTSTQITSGALNASFAELDRHRTWRNDDGDVILPYHPFTIASQRDVVVNDPHEYQIEIFPTDWQLPAGHRLRVVIGTADTPHYQVPADRLQKMLGGTIRVIQGGENYASRLLIPVTPNR